MTIKTNNESYKDRNRNKISTLFGADVVYRDILDFDFLLEDGSTMTVKDLFEKIYSDKDELEEKLKEKEEEIQEANKQIEKLKANNDELKVALKEYIEKEAVVDSANTNSIEILSEELTKVNLKLNEISEKIKFL